MGNPDNGTLSKKLRIRLNTPMMARLEQMWAETRRGKLSDYVRYLLQETLEALESGALVIVWGGRPLPDKRH